MQDHTILALTALVVAGAVEIVALVTGNDGQFLGPFFIFAGAVAGVPTGMALEKRKK